MSLNTLPRVAPHHAETHLAIAAPVSDRAARGTTRHRHSTDIVLARQTSC